MKPILTVCLTNWRRPELLAALIEGVKSQSLACQIFLWNNSEVPVDHHVDWLVNSSRNVICRPRWYMATFAETPYVCIIDDDVEITSPHALEYIVSVLDGAPSSTIVGATGVILGEEGSYTRGNHLEIYQPRQGHVPCDIIKGRLMLMRHDALIRRMRHSPPDDMREDDIAISAMMSAGARLSHLCAQDAHRHFALLDAPHSLHKQPGHYDRRNQAALKWFGQTVHASA